MTPTSTMHGAVKQEEKAHMDIQKILVPVDYSEDSRQALQWGASLAAKYGATLILLQVIPKTVEEIYLSGPEWITPFTPPSYFYEGMAPGSRARGTEPLIIDLQEKARTQLTDFAHTHLKDPVPMDVQVVVGSAAEEIVRVARAQRVDLIVMGTHGRTGLRHLLQGSVAEAVTRQAPCPVFTVRFGSQAAA
jgi:nucleotide-binding universal stress UspA family protein